MFLITTSVSCINIFKLSDLRTSTSIEQKNEALAKEMIANMGRAHGIKNWSDLETYSVLFEDEFYGFLGKFSSPYDTISSSFTLSYVPNTSDGILKFENGDAKGEIWGIYNWDTYSLNDNKEPVFKKNNDAKFWVPTYQYFIEFPLRIQTATVFNYAGEDIVNGVHCKGVIASWNTIDPQKDLDQYVIWLDSKTYQIVKLEYTIRDVNRFVAGATYFKDYKNYDGLLLPTKLSVESNLLREGYLHEMRILDFKANELSRKELQFIRIDKTIR